MLAMGEDVSIGIILSGCNVEKPCMHCLSRDYITGQSLDFGVLETIADGMKGGKIDGTAVREISLSAGEPMAYESGGRKLPEAVSLLAESCRMVSVKTNGVLNGSEEELSIIDGLADIGRERGNTVFWFSMNPYSHGSREEAILRTMERLREGEFPSVYYPEIGMRGATKKISVHTSPSNMMKFVPLVFRLLKNAGYTELEPDVESQRFLFISPSKNDCVEVRSRGLYHVGRAKRFLENEDYHSITECPLLRNGRKPFPFVSNDGTIGYCENFAVLEGKPFGTIMEKSLPEVLDGRKSFMDAVRRMSGSGPDLSGHKYQMCSYCEDNLARYL